MANQAICQKMEELLHSFNTILNNVRRQNGLFTATDQEINSLELKAVLQDNITISREILRVTSESKNRLSSSSDNNTEMMRKLVQLKVLAETIIEQLKPVENQGENRSPPQTSNNYSTVFMGGRRGGQGGAFD
ncbi:PREDICTED: uncharacterized protein LOC105456276 [Wasmannia auropunctata]|uniref:uncharacterized protein LOC105456276 n=1 Tax=Wasmannia auropunctata TaxID=64793 RepID=UPI0005F050F4|nr:PREDICTED: uncharacterized protein LOC105456276 [Wasmannia auropunctata]